MPYTNRAAELAAIADDYCAWRGSAPEEPSWPGFTCATGLELPVDYQELIEALGAHCWVDFLVVLGPFSEAKNSNLEILGRQICGSLLDLGRRRSVLPPWPVWPEPFGVYPWGMTTNGDFLLWKTVGPAERWPLVLVSNSGELFEHEEIGLSVTEVIRRFLDGEIQSEVLLGAFYDNAPRDVWDEVARTEGA